MQKLLSVIASSKALRAGTGFTVALVFLGLVFHTSAGIHKRTRDALSHILRNLDDHHSRQN